ncbi:MAG: hypothetical protein P8L35_02725 [Acidimicrobiales bacterium]|nr:hypothetical protein [Acidimicrobiales bacterium]
MCITEVPVESFGCTKEIAENAYTDTKEYFSNSLEDLLNFDFRIGPNTPNSHLTKVRSALSPGVNFWSSEVPSDESSKIFVLTGNDLEWLYGELSSMGFSTNIFDEETERDLIDGSTAIGVAFRRPSQDGSKVLLFINISFFESYSLPGLASRNEAIFVAAHEWTHLVQGVLSDNDYDSPCWWTEGSATFFGTVIALRENIRNYDEYYGVRIGAVQTKLEDRNASRARQINNWADWLAVEDCTKTSYGAGYLATEYLVGQYGLERAIEVMDLMGTDITWQSAVEQVYGSRYTDLLQEIATHLRYVFLSTGI